MSDSILDHVFDDTPVTLLSARSLIEHDGELYFGGYSVDDAFYIDDAISFACNDDEGRKHLVAIYDCRHDASKVIYLEVYTRLDNGDWWEHEAVFYNIKDVYPYCQTKLSLL